MRRFFALLICPAITVCIPIAAAQEPVSQAEHFPKSPRDFVLQFRKHITDRPTVPPIDGMDGPTEAWTQFITTCAHANGAGEISIVLSPTIQDWCKAIRPEDPNAGALDDLADALMGRWDPSPVLGELRAAISRFEGSATFRQLEALRTPREYWPPVPAARPMLRNIDRVWFGPCRAAARHCRIRALVALHDQDADAFLNAIRDLYSIAAIIQNVPISDAHGVAGAIRLMTDDLIIHAVTTGKLTDEMLDELRDLLGPPGNPPSWAYFVEGERLIALDAIEYLYVESVRTVFHDFVRYYDWRTNIPRFIKRLVLLPRRDSQFTRVDLFFDDLIRSAGPDPAEARAAAERVAAISDWLSTYPERLIAVAGVLGDEWPGRIRRDQTFRASGDGLRTVLAIERFRRTHGQAPESLDRLVPDLLPEVPMDPFTFGEAALRYRVLDPGADAFGRSYLLYAVGGDGVDNHGAENRVEPLRATQKVEGQGLDLIFNRILEWPAIQPETKE